MPEVLLRKSTQNDESFVNDLTHKVMKSYVEKTWATKEDYEQYFYTNRFNLENTNIIQYDGKDAGRLTLIKSTDHIYVDNIHLLPEYQSLGIGKKLLEQIIKDAKEKKLYVRLQVLRANPAKSLYENLGFKVYDENTTHFFMKTD